MAMDVKWELDEQNQLVPIVDMGTYTRRAAWAPQPGSQQIVMSSPVYELLYYGNRGPGKSETLLMTYAQHVGKGFGSSWRGLISRRQYSELSDLISKAKFWFSRLFPGSYYNKGDHIYHFPDGEWLEFSYFEKEEHYDKYHGHQIPFIAHDELSLHPTPSAYLKLMSCSRSSHPGIPIMYRAATNPYGVGAGWIRRRFKLFQPHRGVIGPYVDQDKDSEGKSLPARVSVRGMLHENKILLHAQPRYEQLIRVAAKNEAQLRAWLYADWNVMTGGMFDDVWQAEHSAVPSFPPHLIPNGWRIDRAYDHGQSAPFSVGWWAESNGEPFEYNGRLYGPVRGDLILFNEWYGWNGEENVGVRMAASAIGRGVRDREADMGIADRVRPGPADDQIFVDDPNLRSRSIAGEFASVGVIWERGKKGPGSRKAKWELMRRLMRNAVPVEGYREKPGIFVTERCQHWMRLIPVAPRDNKDPDDVDTNWEDHVLDMAGYRIFSDPRLVKVLDW